MVYCSVLFSQVKILFSDKTGTLTKNEMILQQCSIHGKKYKIQNFGLREENCSYVMRLPQYDPYMRNFFQTLSICHTVQVAKLEQNQEEDSAADLEASFDIIESSDSSLVDIDDNDAAAAAAAAETERRKRETIQNTKQNEAVIRRPTTLVDDFPAVVAPAREY